MSTELVKIEVAELEESKAKALEALYAPMVKYYGEKETAVADLLGKELDKNTVKECYTLRQELRAKRLEGTKNVKPEIEKANRNLKALKAVNTNIDFLSKPLEENLLSRENEFKQQEEKAKLALHNERKEALEAVGDTIERHNLDKMSKVNFKALLEVTQYDVEQQKEKERIEAEEAKKKADEEAAEKKRLEDEVAKLKEDAKKAAKIIKDKEDADKVIADKKAADDKIISDKAAAEKKELQDKLDALEQEKNDRIKEDARLKQVEDDRLQKIKDDKKAEEDKIEADKLALKQKEEADKRAEELKPEKEKIHAWINSFSIPEMDTMEFSEEGQQACNDIDSLFNAFVVTAKEKLEAIK